MIGSPLDHAKGHEINWEEVPPIFNVARLIVGCTFVYVIGEREDGHVKIGFAKDPIKRLRSMQTGNPRYLRVEFVLMGDMAMEKLLHELWEPFAVFAVPRQGKVDVLPGTEWFKPEVREKLFPIMETAANLQAQFIFELSNDNPTGPDVNPRDLERELREAHVQHGFEFKRRDEVRLLGAGGGTTIRRRSRV